MKKVFLILSIIASQGAQALDCDRPIQKIFTGYTSSGSKIHVSHGDDHAASIVRLDTVNGEEKHVDRILSVLLAAHLGGRNVTFRYMKGADGSAATCTPTSNQLTSAVWIK